MTTSRQDQEHQHFAKLAQDWWDPDGPFKPLHTITPLRLDLIDRWAKEKLGAHRLQGLRVLDVGCGGGLVSEPLALQGAQVTGLDMVSQSIQVAQSHKAETWERYRPSWTPHAPFSKGLENLTYFPWDLDHYLTRPQNQGGFDIVLCLELLEHVESPQTLLSQCVKTLKPGGLWIGSTFNRTFLSYVLGILGAEHILKWVPKGTHQWKSFILPEELEAYGKKAGLSPLDFQGLNYNLLKGWHLSPPIHTQYFASGVKLL